MSRLADMEKVKNSHVNRELYRSKEFKRLIGQIPAKDNILLKKVSDLSVQDGDIISFDELRLRYLVHTGTELELENFRNTMRDIIKVHG